MEASEEKYKLTLAEAILDRLTRGQKPISFKQDKKKFNFVAVL
jgi:hypothetical protein